MDAVEADVGRACDELMAGAGWRVERYEQRRSTQVEEGLPDRRYVQAGRGLRLWVELKRPGGKGQLTRDQHRWLLAELDAGGWAVAVDDVAQLVVVLNLMTGGRPGRDELVRGKCAHLVALMAGKGYRGEPLPGHLLKRKRPSAAGGSRSRSPG